MGIIRWLYFIWTLIFAGPLALNGVLALIDGDYIEGVFFVGLALVVFVVFEYLYVKLINWIGRD